MAAVTCAVCGKPIEGDPVWVVFGDEEFKHKRVHPGDEVPFPLDEDCFKRDRKLTVTRWNAEGTALEEFETTRYVEVKK